MRLVGYPRPAQLEDYARAAEEIERQLAALPGLIAIYSVGGVSAPGISDLDRVAVVSGTGKVPSIWPRLSEETRALAMHPPFLVDRRTFANHRLIAYLEPAELTAGEAIEVEDPPAPDYIRRVLGAESILLNLVRMLKYRVTGRLKVRAVLCQLHTVRHGLTLAGLDRSEAGRAWGLADEVAALRDVWFTLEPARRDEDIRQLVLDASGALTGALDALAARLPTRSRPEKPLALGGAWAGVSLLAAKTRPTPSPIAGGRFARELSSWSSKTAEATWRLRRHDVLVPPDILCLLGDGSAEYESVRERRLDLLTSHHAFLADSGVGYTSIAIGPSLRSA